MWSNVFKQAQVSKMNVVKGKKLRGKNKLNIFELNSNSEVASHSSQYPVIDALDALEFAQTIDERKGKEAVQKTYVS